MIDETEFERAARWFASSISDAALHDARSRFEHATGPIVEASPDFDARMAHFWEQLMCTATEGKPPLSRYACTIDDQRPGAGEARAQLAGWLRSHRGLFEIGEVTSDTLVVRDLWLHGVYRCGVAPQDRRLAPGDRFEARLVAEGGQLWLSSGRLFYQPDTHRALDAVLHAAPRTLGTAALLDALLRMRSSHQRFESIRAEHVFRVEALHADALSASWVKPRARL